MFEALRARLRRPQDGELGEPLFHGNRLLTGGDSGEHETRMQLLLALGAGWNVEFEVDRDAGDTLTLVSPQGDRFEFSAERIRMRWRQA